ncbi:MAG: citrate synthase [Eggerthellaceae bacterium]|nr:citrate synthase [Eggerthellaceae bacterium]
MADRIALYDNFAAINRIDPALYARYDVKRGLRNADGTGVVAGITNISDVHGYKMVDGVKTPDEGVLHLRGYNLNDLVCPTDETRRFNFEEVAYLLLMGELPTPAQLEAFIAAIDDMRELPDGFTASMIMRDTPRDIMNLLSRTILELYAHDPAAEDRGVEHEVHTAVSLISKLPRIMVLAYHAIECTFNQGSMFIHRFIPGQSTAETILSMLRPSREFTPEEARMLDIMLCLHAEHGGGNNSTFTTRVLSSADTDAYSAYAAAIGSLKGFRHGGANHKVRAMHADIRENCLDWADDAALTAYLEKILRRDAFDGSGLIYGMGHAVYTLSDPRARICKAYAEKLAKGTPFEEEFALLDGIERLTPVAIANVKGREQVICANIDMYSGLVYTMLGIPEEMFTPMFACGRMPGWAAHRFEETCTGRIIRPAYQTTYEAERAYVPLAERE